jgi:hypothetical protein
MKNEDKIAVKSQDISRDKTEQYRTIKVARERAQMRRKAQNIAKIHIYCAFGG